MAALSVDPSRCLTPADAARLYREEVQNQGAPILKLHPRLNGYDPLDPRCLATLEAAAIAPRPPLIWLNTLLYRRGLRLEKPPIHALHHILNCFSTLTFVLLHGAGSDVLPLAETIRDCQNAFIDISFTPTRYEGSSVWQDLRFLLGSFDRRIVFGSDFPEVTATAALASFRRLSDGVDPEKCQNVLSNNLHSLLFSGGKPTRLLVESRTHWTSVA